MAPNSTNETKRARRRIENFISVSDICRRLTANLRAFLLTLGLATVVAAEPAVALPGSMGAFMARQGFDAVQLQRRFGNHLWLTASINGKRAKLLVDDSAPITVIHRESAETFGLIVTPTNERVVNIFEQTQTYSRSTVRSLQIGQRNFADMPVFVAPELVWLTPPEFLIVPALKKNAKRRKFSDYVRIDPVNGLLGADVLRKTSAVLDCGHQTLYLRKGGTTGVAAGVTDPGLNRGAKIGAGEELAAFLRERGFTRIEMHLTRNNQFEVDAAINDQATRLLVNTGSSFTFVARPFAAAAGVASAPLRLAYPSESGQLMPISEGRAKTLTIGDFVAHDVSVTIADISKQILRQGNSLKGNAGLLGLELLSRNFAVIDFGNMSLYLRRPD